VHLSVFIGVHLWPNPVGLHLRLCAFTCGSRTRGSEAPRIIKDLSFWWHRLSSLCSPLGREAPPTAVMHRRGRRDRREFAERRIGQGQEPESGRHRGPPSCTHETSAAETKKADDVDSSVLVGVHTWPSPFGISLAQAFQPVLPAWQGGPAHSGHAPQRTQRPQRVRGERNGAGTGACPCHPPTRLLATLSGQAQGPAPINLPTRPHPIL